MDEVESVGKSTKCLLSKRTKQKSCTIVLQVLSNQIISFTSFSTSRSLLVYTMYGADECPLTIVYQKSGGREMVLPAPIGNEGEAKKLPITVDDLVRGAERVVMENGRKRRKKNA